jgi:hypothetical protein
MDAAKKLDREIANYLTRLNEDQKMAVLTVVKTFAAESDYDHWLDPSFVEEMETRYAELKTGKDKGLTLDELEEGARKAYKNRKKK